jgi:hypothetical protein
MSLEETRWSAVNIQLVQLRPSTQLRIRDKDLVEDIDDAGLTWTERSGEVRDVQFACFTIARVEDVFAVATERGRGAGLDEMVKFGRL